MIWVLREYNEIDPIILSGWQIFLQISPFFSLVITQLTTARNFACSRPDHFPPLYEFKNTTLISLKINCSKILAASKFVSECHKIAGKHLAQNGKKITFPQGSMGHHFFMDMCLISLIKDVIL